MKEVHALRSEMNTSAKRRLDLSQRRGFANVLVDASAGSVSGPWRDSMASRRGSAKEPIVESELRESAARMSAASRIRSGVHSTENVARATLDNFKLRFSQNQLSQAQQSGDDSFQMLMHPSKLTVRETPRDANKKVTQSIINMNLLSDLCHMVDPALYNDD